MKVLIKQHAYSGLLTVSSWILQEQNKLNAQLKYIVMVWHSAEKSARFSSLRHDI